MKGNKIFGDELGSAFAIAVGSGPAKSTNDCDGDDCPDGKKDKKKKDDKHDHDECHGDDCPHFLSA